MKAYLLPKKKPTDRHWYAYDVEFNGELLVTDSRDPYHDLDRPPSSRHHAQGDATRWEHREDPHHHRHREGCALVRWKQPRKVPGGRHLRYPTAARTFPKSLWLLSPYPKQQTRLLEHEGQTSFRKELLMHSRDRGPGLLVVGRSRRLRRSSGSVEIGH